MFVLNPQLGKPLYRQLADQVRRMVASGDLKPGDMLPSVRTVASDHAVNPMTISKAYALLETEGLLERNPGKPMTVATPRLRGDRSDPSKHLERPARELVRIAHEFDIERHEVIALLEEYWRKSDV